MNETTALMKRGRANPAYNMETILTAGAVLNGSSDDESCVYESFATKRKLARDTASTKSRAKEHIQDIFSGEEEQSSDVYDASRTTCSEECCDYLRFPWIGLT